MEIIQIRSAAHNQQPRSNIRFDRTDTSTARMQSGSSYLHKCGTGYCTYSWLTDRTRIQSEYSRYLLTNRVETSKYNRFQKFVSRFCFRSQFREQRHRFRARTCGPFRRFWDWLPASRQRAQANWPGRHTRWPQQGQEGHRRRFSLHRRYSN